MILYVSDVFPLIHLHAVVIEILLNGGSVPLTSWTPAGFLFMKWTN